MRWIAALLAMLLLTACGGGPNLDEALPGQQATAIRSAVAGHMNWDDKLTADQLDSLTTFLATYAGSSESPPASNPGLDLWRANDCSRCHVLAAGQEAGGS